MSFYQFFLNQIKDKYNLCPINRNPTIFKKVSTVDQTSTATIINYEQECTEQHFRIAEKKYQNEKDPKQIVIEALKNGTFSKSLHKAITGTDYHKVYIGEIYTKKTTQVPCQQKYEQFAIATRNTMIDIIFDYIVAHGNNMFLYGTYCFNKFYSNNTAAPNKWFSFSSPLETSDIDMTAMDTDTTMIDEIFNGLVNFANNYVFCADKTTSTKVGIHELKLNIKNEHLFSINIEFRCHDCDQCSYFTHYLYKSKLLDCSNDNQTAYNTKFAIRHKNIQVQHPLVYLVGMVYTLFNIWNHPLPTLTVKHKISNMEKWISRFKKLGIHTDQFTEEDIKMIEQVKSINTEYNTPDTEQFFTLLISGQETIDSLLMRYKRFLISNNHLVVSDLTL
jgi:hypothetical protein